MWWSAVKAWNTQSYNQLIYPLRFLRMLYRSSSALELGLREFSQAYMISRMSSTCWRSQVSSFHAYSCRSSTIFVFFILTLAVYDLYFLAMRLSRMIKSLITSRFRSLIQWIIPSLFSLFTDARHILIPRQRWYIDWLIGSIVYTVITKNSPYANHLSCYKMSHNTTKNISTQLIIFWITERRYDLRDAPI